jgi:hypothetical protein
MSFRPLIEAFGTTEDPAASSARALCPVKKGSLEVDVHDLVEVRLLELIERQELSDADTGGICVDPRELRIRRRENGDAPPDVV